MTAKKILTPQERGNIASEKLNKVDAAIKKNQKRNGSTALLSVLRKEQKKLWGEIQAIRAEITGSDDTAGDRQPSRRFQVR